MYNIYILRAKSKVVYSKLLGKDKNSYCRQIFDKEWGKCKYEVEEGSSGCMDIIIYEVNSFLLGF